MHEIKFYSTNNPWMNNGMVIMAQEMQRYYEDEIEIRYDKDSIFLRSNNENKDIMEYIAETMQTLAGNGTYNFSTTFKILNNEKNLGTNYSPGKTYPDSNEDLKETIKISTDEELSYLKKRKHKPNKEEKVWKMRSSYLGKHGEYFSIGLNFKDHKTLENLILDKENKINCPLCGMPSKTLETVRQFFNPLANEHHNNKLDGVGQRKEASKICTKCVISCYFSLFSPYIPFYYVASNRETCFAIPDTVDINVLKKVNNNLSLRGQYIDFSDPSCESYGTNIKNLPNKSKSASLLALLHNIKNEYHLDEPKSLFESLDENEFNEISEWLFFTFKKGRVLQIKNIKQIKSAKAIYNILEPFQDIMNDKDIYLIPDFLNKFSFDIFNENEVEMFFNGILTLNSKKLTEGLFRLAKESVSRIDKIRPNTSFPLALFTNVFLGKIMEESTMLDNNLKDAYKNIAETVGKGFREDVGMLTKFAYSSSPREFKKALEEASFRLAKISAADEKMNFYLNANHLGTVLDSINHANFEDAKNYFVSFMSAYVLWENSKKRNNKSKQEK